MQSNIVLETQGRLLGTYPSFLITQFNQLIQPNSLLMIISVPMPIQPVIRTLLQNGVFEHLPAFLFSSSAVNEAQFLHLLNSLL